MFIQGTLDESNNVIIPTRPLVWVGDVSGGEGGPITNTQLTAVTGTAAQTAITTDPAAANQTLLAVMRGILAELQTQTLVLNDIKTNTTA